jgi:hypothetical protein
MKDSTNRSKKYQVVFQCWVYPKKFTAHAEIKERTPPISTEDKSKIFLVN